MNKEFKNSVMASILFKIGKLRFDLKQLLNFFRMFLSPVRISYRTDEKCKNHSNSQKKNSKLIHKFYSSLLKKNIPITNITKTKNPTDNDANEIVFGAATFAIKIVTNIICAKFRHNVAKALFCFLFNFINNIILQLKESVKFDVKNYYLEMFLGY